MAQDYETDKNVNHVATIASCEETCSKRTYFVVEVHGVEIW